MSLQLEIMHFITVSFVSHQYSLELSELSQYEDAVLHSAQRVFFNCFVIPDPPSVPFPPSEMPILSLLIFLNL